MELLGPSKDSLQEDFLELQDSGVDAYFADHMNYLTDQLFLVQDGSIEARVLKKQIRELGYLNEMYKNEFQTPFTRESNRDISEKFGQILGLLQSGRHLDDIREEINTLIDEELDRLKDTINPLFARSPRDIVEKNINILGVVGESIFSNPEVIAFYELFTLEYINLVGRDNSGIDGILQCNSSELLEIMKAVKSRLSVDDLNKLHQTFRFQTLDGEIDMSFDSIFIPKESYTHDEITVYLSRGIDLNNFTEHLTKQEVVDLYTSRIITQEQLWSYFSVYGSHYEIITLFENNALSREHMDEYVERINRNFSLEEVQQLFRVGAIDAGLAYSLLEGEDGFQVDKHIYEDSDGNIAGFSLSDALEQFGFSHQLGMDIDVIFPRELNTEEKEHLLRMIRFFTYVESSGGYNVSNYQGVSSAKGYFQYLTGNGRRNAKGEWLTNSYETGLQTIPEVIRQSRTIFQEQLDIRSNSEYRNTIDIPDQDPRNLSGEEQIILFLSDLLKRRGAKDYIAAMLTGNIDAVKELYRLHHTNTDHDTEYRMRLGLQEVYGIEIEVYEQIEDGRIVGNIFRKANMTEFFYGLIYELNPDMGLSQSDVMRSLDELGFISFQAGSRVEISWSQEEGVAYELLLNGEPYIKVLNGGKFVSLR